MLNNGLIDVSNLSTRIIKRDRSECFYKTVKKDQVDAYINEGWELIPSKLSKSDKLRKKKPHDIAFEDRIWSLLARMRFQTMNKDRNLKIEYQNGLKKQIDVFAVDDEAIIIVECKSSEKPKKVNYQKDINELIGIKERIRSTVRNLFSSKLKVAFIFATNNSVIGDNDKKRLKEDHIFHFNQDDIEYYEGLTDHLGVSAKYQLFGKLFAGQKIPELPNRAPAIMGKVSAGHTFYSFSIEPKYLLKIGFILHRSDMSKDAAGAYQRLVKKSRLKQIGQYITKGGYFPNSIIINIQTKSKQGLKFERANPIECDSSTKMGILHLPKIYRSAFIIDGQHRLYGYSVTKSKSNHTIPVVAFHNLPVEEQSKIFIDINHTQKSVPANLLSSIMADFNWNSPNDRLALSALKTRLFIVMDSDESSPFYKRIIVSEEKKTSKRCLTLETIKTWGLNKVNFFGKIKGNNIVKYGYLSDVDYEKTLIKAVAFFNKCFSEIEKNLHDQWNLGSAEGGFISMNIGVSSVIRIIDNIIEYLSIDGTIKPEDLSGDQLADEVIPYLDPVITFIKNLNSEGISKLRSLFGSGATEKVLREFQNSIHKDEPSFNPEGLEQWQKDNSGVFNLPAYELGHNFMEPLIDKFIRKMLKKELGEKKWWIDGVPKNIQTDCAAKRIQQGSEEPDQNFLNTIHYQKIVEDNWPLLGEYFTKPGSDNLKKSKKLDWFHKFNVIRQKYSHPQRENTTEAEYEFLKELHDWLKDKLVL